MYSGGEYWCDNQWFRERSDSFWLSYVPIHLQLFREYIRDIGTAPLHVCEVGKKSASFCSLAISRPGETDWPMLTEAMHTNTNGVKTDDMYLCDILRWSSLKKLGVRCSSCVPSSGPCPWTAVLFCLCQIFLPHSRPRSASPQPTCASWKRSLIASRPWLLTLLSLPAWKPLYCSSQVMIYSFSSMYLLLNGRCN